MKGLGRIGGVLVGCILIASAVMMARGRRIEVPQAPRSVAPDAGGQYQRRIRATERLLLEDHVVPGRR